MQNNTLLPLPIIIFFTLFPEVESIEGILSTGWDLFVKLKQGSDNQHTSDQIKRRTQCWMYHWRGDDPGLYRLGLTEKKLFKLSEEVDSYLASIDPARFPIHAPLNLEEILQDMKTRLDFVKRTLYKFFILFPEVESLYGSDGGRGIHVGLKPEYPYPETCSGSIAVRSLGILVDYIRSQRRYILYLSDRRIIRMSEYDIAAAVEDYIQLTNAQLPIYMSNNPEEALVKLYKEVRARAK